jgi:hypothetical protein
LITKYEPSLLPPPVQPNQSIVEGDESILQDHLEGALEAIWTTSEGSWSKLMTTLQMELDKQIEESSQWMRASIVAANELSEARLELESGLDLRL